MLWHICRNYQPYPPPQPPMLYWNVSLFKYYHDARDSKLLIRKGLYFLHPAPPSPSCLCLFALHLFEVFLCLDNRELPLVEEVFVYVHLCSNNTIGFPELLEVVIAMILMNRIHVHMLFVKLHFSFVHIHVRVHLFWDEFICSQVSACVHVNNTAQFPFLWTIQLPLSRRLMERALLDQCHRASGMPRSVSTVLLLPLLPLTPSLHALTLCHTYTLSHRFTFFLSLFLTHQQTGFILTFDRPISIFLPLTPQPVETQT